MRLGETTSDTAAGEAFRVQLTLELEQIKVETTVNKATALSMQDYLRANF